jgi:hypothetical protein
VAKRTDPQDPPPVQDEHAPLQHTTPRPLLRTGQLHDPDAVSDVWIQDLSHGAAPGRAAEEPHVLVQQAVGNEHDAVPASIRQLLTNATGSAVRHHVRIVRAHRGDGVGAEVPSSTR